MPLRFYAVLRFAVQRVQVPLPHEQHAADRADDALQQFVRELDERGFGRCVNERSAQRIADHENDRADRHADPGGEHGMLFERVVRDQRDRQRLQAVRRERYEHRQRIKQQVAEERTDAADEKRRQRIEQYRRRADHRVAKVQVAAGYGDAERTHHDVHRHKQRGRGQPDNGSVCILFHLFIPLIFDLL